jgi:hypothetical protein
MLRKLKPVNFLESTDASQAEDIVSPHRAHNVARSVPVSPVPQAGTMRRIAGIVGTPINNSQGTEQTVLASKAGVQWRVPTPGAAAGLGFGFVLVLLVIFYPVLVLLLGLFFAALISAIYVGMGYDAFWEMLLKPVRWHVARQPQSAGAIHQKIDHFAVRWDAILDRFPDGWVAALYLPDVSDIAALAREDEAKFELRMDGLAQTQKV